MHRYGYGKANELRECLLKLALAYGLIICNARFHQHRSEVNMIVSRSCLQECDQSEYCKKSVQIPAVGCRMFQIADVSSDHNFVLKKCQTEAEVNVW